MLTGDYQLTQKLMSDDLNKQKTSLNPYAPVALFAGLASVAIAFFAFAILRYISDSGMWAIAAMVAAPAAMGVGIAFFISKRRPQ